MQKCDLANESGFICRYASQCGRPFEEKQLFCELKNESWDLHSVDIVVVCFGDCIGHMRKHADCWCSWRVWLRSVEFVRVSITRLLLMNVKYVV